MRLTPEIRVLLRGAAYRLFARSRVRIPGGARSCDDGLCAQAAAKEEQ